MELINLSKYVERSYEETPIPEGWVQYGEDNLYPQYLVNLYQSSATHGALCMSIAQLFMGAGLDASEEQAKAKLAEWSCEDELPKAFLDLKVQGGFALEVQWTMDRSTILNVRHLPFENVRSGHMDIDERVRYYYYSTNWEECHHPDHTPQRIRAYHPDDRDEHSTQILYVKPFGIGSQFYPKPDYLGAVNYIELERSISEYHRNNLANGLAPSFHIAFANGLPPIEERQKIRRDIEAQLSGSTNAGKFIITYSDDADRKPTFEPFPVSDVDKQYEFLSGETTDKIMVGHRVVSPAMFGVKTAGELGNTEELQIASQLFDVQVVAPAQKLMAKTMGRLLADCGIVSQVSITSNNPFLNVDKERDAFAKVKKYDTKWLIEQREEIDPDEYELIDERPVEYDREDKRDILTNLARKVQKSKGVSDYDTPLFKVRYFYDGNNPKKNSRDFCSLMVKAGGVYKREDIEKANGKSLGASPNVWLEKGGINCFHYWTRRTYLRKNGRKLSEGDVKKLLDELDRSEKKANKIEKEDRRVGIAPRDMGMTNF